MDDNECYSVMAGWQRMQFSDGWMTTNDIQWWLDDNECYSVMARWQRMLFSDGWMTTNDIQWWLDDDEWYSVMARWHRMLFSHGLMTNEFRLKNIMLKIRLRLYSLIRHKQIYIINGLNQPWCEKRPIYFIWVKDIPFPSHSLNNILSISEQNDTGRTILIQMATSIAVR